MSREYEKIFVSYRALEFRNILPSTVLVCGIFFLKMGRDKSWDMFDTMLLRTVKENARSGLEIIISVAQKPYSG